MSKAYSADIRGRVIARIEDGATRREAAEHFEVNASAAVKWMKCFRETGSCVAKPRGAAPRRWEEHANFLLTLVAEQPDLTLDEVVSTMRRRKVRGSRTAVWRFSLSATRSQLKKSLHAAEQERPDVAWARQRWKREQGMLIQAGWCSLMTAANTKMARLRGRCPRGERLVGRVPHGHWKTITFVSALRRNGMTAPFVVDSAMNGRTFLAYIKSCLAPPLRRRDIV